MHTPPRPVRSAQTAPHPGLARLLERHARTVFRKPPAPYSRDAFARFQDAWDGATAPVLDAGCGTGESTFNLARRHPQRLVVGVDQSAQRLGRLARAERPQNALLLRADIVDIWRLMDEAGVSLAAHYLLYPNPWPKPAQVLRRWHAHPVFPRIVALGGRIECRSNWRVFAEEFAVALRWHTGIDVAVENCGEAMPLTPFERKYAAAGHVLYRVAAELPGRAGPSQSAP